MTAAGPPGLEAVELGSGLLLTRLELGPSHWLLSQQGHVSGSCECCRHEVTCWSVPSFTAADQEGHPTSLGLAAASQRPQGPAHKAQQGSGVWTGPQRTPAWPLPSLHPFLSPIGGHRVALLLGASSVTPSGPCTQSESPAPPSRTPALASPWKQPPWPPSSCCFLGTPVETRGRVP